jgi:hypothetical protein
VRRSRPIHVPGCLVHAFFLSRRLAANKYGVDIRNAVRLLIYFGSFG